MTRFYSAFWPFKQDIFFRMAAEAGLFTVALLTAYLLRFDFSFSGPHIRQMLGLLPLAVALKLGFFFFSGLYRGMWRYTGLFDLWRIARAIFLAESVLALSVALSTHFQGYPRSIFILDPMLAFLLACTARALTRTLHELSKRKGKWTNPLLPNVFCTPQPGSRAFILGADDESASMAKEIQESGASGRCLVGFVDDDPKRIGRHIHGLQIFGPLSDLGELMLKAQVEELLVSASRNLSSQARPIMKACETARVRIKKLPALSDIVAGKVSIKELRDVRYEDLLGRDEVRLDEAGVKSYLQDKVVLVTGAGGSIGSELCRQIRRFSPRQMILFDAGEANLYNIEMELLHKHAFTRYITVLGQVQDEALVEGIFATHQPQVVFHAAAYKHVPMLEVNPWQAVTNNILGSQIVMAASARFDAERFVLVSTDKAVRPTNVMGASKRVAELLMRGFSGQKTKFMAVRFGNVLGSSGSVIPLFRRQIESGGPVTVTHPDVTRYFMTIPEAAQLIIQAGALGLGNEIFVLKMGNPVRVADLAKDLILLSGKDPAEVKITFTGLRPGEKLYEELITDGEDVLETGHEKITVLRAGQSEEDIKGTLAKSVEALNQAAKEFDGLLIKNLLSDLLGEYVPDKKWNFTLQHKKEHA